MNCFGNSPIRICTDIPRNLWDQSDQHPHLLDNLDCLPLVGAGCLISTPFTASHVMSGTPQAPRCLARCSGMQFRELDRGRSSPSDSCARPMQLMPEMLWLRHRGWGLRSRLQPTCGICHTTARTSRPPPRPSLGFVPIGGRMCFTTCGPVHGGAHKSCGSAVTA